MKDRISWRPVAAFLYGLLVPWAAAGAVIGAASRISFPGSDVAFFVVWVPLIVLSSGALAACTDLPLTKFVPAAAFGSLAALVGFPLATGGGGPIWMAISLFGLTFTTVGAVGTQLLRDPDGEFWKDRLWSYVLTAAVVGCASMGLLAVAEVSAPYQYSPGLRRVLVTGLLLVSPVAGFTVAHYTRVPVRTLLSGIVLFPFLAILLDYELVGLAATMAGLVAAGALTVSIGRGLGRW
ncbi:hypothetical protein [Natrialba taiwanensis]|uniref:Uncharacterized protein n=1 Tax=Natrialba taiwanensis DSM 12281 TaxID=1230458 RepID=L9ZJL2_9EURY|nr:hypothetical protein [Natrialba taiwanensis]ELY86236.1 hypothetical protein C484_18507 [Natrialba taiwanensis DSM 12281]